jgi:hypothetical protein
VLGTEETRCYAEAMQYHSILTRKLRRSTAGEKAIQ